LAGSVARYRSRRRDDAELRARLRDLAEQHPRFGYLRLHALLRRRHRRRPPKRERLRLVVPERRNQRWSMDFASDALWTGRRFRCLCIVDEATRESAALLADFSIGDARVVRLLDELACRHGLPEEIVVDNGPKSTGRALFAWSARTGVRLRFIQPGKPIQNTFVESFIGRFRDECLNQHWFGSLAEAAGRRGLAQKRHRSGSRIAWCCRYEVASFSLALAGAEGASDAFGCPAQPTRCRTHTGFPRTPAELLGHGRGV
jgi:putative transposase